MRVLRRVAAGCAGVVLLAAMAPLLSACGGTGQITVTLHALGDEQASYKPGTTAKFAVSMVNNGPGDAPGVAVVVAMPSTFQYTATNGINDSGSARTQPLDARVGTSDPQWGFWDIAAPASGKQQAITIVFSVMVKGSPNTYQLSARAQGDNTAGTIVSKPFAVQVVPAPQLAVQAKIDRSTLRGGDATNYRINIINTGSDTASQVAVLVTLPPVMTFENSVTPFAGNGSEGSLVTPFAGGLEAFYSGFSLPAASSGGPGYITIVFRVQVVSRPAAGAYSITVQVTDSAGDVVNVSGAAPIQVQGSTASPTPTVVP